MAANNQGIMHLRLGGYRSLACKRTNAHMAVAAAEFEGDPKKCKRCAAIWSAMKSRKAEIDARKQEART